MLLTDQFTYIHQPKTGGTFVAATLVGLHEARGDIVVTVTADPSRPDEIPAPAPGQVVRLMHPTRHQHGTRRDIPPAARHRPVLATVRNPFDRYVSQFEFAWWRVYPEMFGPVDRVRASYPTYPDLTFADFVALTNAVSVHYRHASHPDGTPGFHTQQFVEYFCEEPEAVLPRLSDAAAADALRAEVHRGIRFLRQDRLNDQLADVLAEVGYGTGEVDAVRRAAPIWPPEGGRPADSAWEPYYTDDLRTFVRRKERWLFEWFPDFDR